MKKLNVGCGQDIRKGWVNLDCHNRYGGVNVVYDLSKIAYYPFFKLFDLKVEKPSMPFKDNSFDYILCSHVLEDFPDPLPFMEEFIRLTKPKGLIEIRTPNETHVWCNLYHKRGFSLTAWQVYMKQDNYSSGAQEIELIEQKYYYSVAKYKSFIIKAYGLFWSTVYNLLGRRIVDTTWIKYLVPNMCIKVVFMKK
jgi:predicted SAM-dependent methyltransferase